MVAAISNGHPAYCENNYGIGVMTDLDEQFTLILFMIYLSIPSFVSEEDQIQHGSIMF